MNGPKLMGMISLPIPRIRRQSEGGERPDGVREIIAQVGFDVDGQAWGLVVSRTPIEPAVSSPPGGLASRIGAARRSTMFRLEFVRWVRFNAIAFAPDEVVTQREWDEERPA